MQAGDGIGYCMQDDIGIAVTLQSDALGDTNTAEKERF